MESIDQFPQDDYTQAHQQSQARVKEHLADLAASQKWCFSNHLVC